MRFVTFKELKTVYGIPYCRTHIYRLVEAGKFPAWIQLSEHRVVWVSSHIEEWMRSHT